jgi:S-adenosylmethionine:tRNA ribosyltransferase-isomerase
MSLPAFELPLALEAHEPPEVHGTGRDDVKLMVATRGDGRLEHAGFRDLVDLLDPGDLLVLNVSATLPAAVAARREDGTEVRVHFSTRAPRLDDSWRVAELRSADGSRPARGEPGERLALGGQATLTLVAPYASGARLLLARFDGPGSVEHHLGEYGEPIRYSHVSRRWPLSAYQTVYAATPGSAEMPSAGRPFTGELITQLIGKGVLLATVTLHAGVSSPERSEPPFAEHYEVPSATAALVREVRGSGGRVIAVGTTVVRALESAVEAEGTIAAASGWTGLVITPAQGPHVVDGLITGWHEPEASHLQLLDTFTGDALLARCYREALDHGYLWHEFGDSHLILP